MDNNKKGGENETKSRVLFIVKKHGKEFSPLLANTRYLRFKKKCVFFLFSRFEISSPPVKGRVCLLNVWGGGVFLSSPSFFSPFFFASVIVLLNSEIYFISFYFI